MDKRKKLLLSVLSVMVVVLLGIVAYYAYNNTYYVSTEDAKVSGDIARINAQMQGKLMDLDIEEGMVVHQDQIIGRQEAPGQSDTTLEKSLLRSPIEGVVIKKQGVPGEIVSTGQAVAMVVDPNKMYIEANIKETRINRIVVGQEVDVTLDQFGSKKWKGHVSLIGKASNSTFSLLSSSSDGSFTKVIQKIPVRITVDTEGAQLVQGTNAEVKIHVR